VKKLRIISVLLLLVMTIQMLPIVQIGFALGSNLWTEEITHGCGEDSGKTDFSIKNYLPAAPHQFASNLFCLAANIYIHTSERIPSNHSNDVLTPPPDEQA
jgi:hypothetical protein